MTTRILPPDEWPRLAGTEADQVWAHLDPSTAQVLVVEDDGVIVGCWILMQMYHVECLWVSPDHRQQGAVQRRLWTGMQRQAEAVGATVVQTAAVSDQVRDLLDHVRAQKIPGDAYALVMGGRRALKLGEQFHEQLEALLGHEQHPDCPAHNIAVGKALIMALEEDNPEGACATYNAWARTAGYESIHSWTREGEIYIVDIGTAIIEIDAVGNVALGKERCL